MLFKNSHFFFAEHAFDTIAVSFFGFPSISSHQPEKAKYLFQLVVLDYSGGVVCAPDCRGVRLQRVSRP
jgi:hypothetical protein